MGNVIQIYYFQASHEYTHSQRRGRERERERNTYAIFMTLVSGRKPGTTQGKELSTRQISSLNPILRLLVGKEAVLDHKSGEQLEEK